MVAAAASLRRRSTTSLVRCTTLRSCVSCSLYSLWQTAVQPPVSGLGQPPARSLRRLRAQLRRPVTARSRSGHSSTATSGRGRRARAASTRLPARAWPAPGLCKPIDRRHDAGGLFSEVEAIDVVRQFVSSHVESAQPARSSHHSALGAVSRLQLDELGTSLGGEAYLVDRTARQWTPQQLCASSCCWTTTSSCSGSLSSQVGQRVVFFAGTPRRPAVGPHRT